MAESVLAIIGGGRWGQVLLSVIAEMSTPFDHVVIVSKANAAETKETVSSLNLISPIPVEILPTIDDLFAKYTLKAAIVVNSARQHFETARQLINRGVHVYIEKPVVLSDKQMQELIDEAQLNKISIVPGLNYRFCSYIKNFSLEVTKKGVPDHFILKWSDPQNEIRHGKVKRHDLSISIVQDVMPHIWTILSIVFQHPKIYTRACLQDNSSATLNLSINNIEGQVLLQRNGTKRQRYLSLQFDSGVLALDFSNEPGVIFMDSQQLSADPFWEQNPGPLMQQLEHFFSVVENGKPTQADLQCCMESVSCTELAVV